MREFYHPMRDAELHTFERSTDSGKGAVWIARFYPYDTYPVFFHGATEADAIKNAEAIRSEAIEKYEAGVIARKEAQKKAAETRARKREATS